MLTIYTLGIELASCHLSSNRSEGLRQLFTLATISKYKRSLGLFNLNIVRVHNKIISFRMAAITL